MTVQKIDPKKIKKGLECCSTCGDCPTCEYSTECNYGGDSLEPFLNGEPLMRDALEYIRQLEHQLPKQFVWNKVWSIAKEET